MSRSRGYIALRALILCAFLVLVARLWYMQVVQVEAYRDQAVARAAQYRTVLAPRGIIYDRNGLPLVRNLPSLDVAVVPDKWPARKAGPESRWLSGLLHHDPSPEVIRAIVARARLNDPTHPVLVKARLGLRTFYIVRSHEDRMPGVEASVDLTVRQYLDSGLYPLAHIVGYTGPIDPAQYRIDADPKGPYRRQRYTSLDSVGRTGIEAVFEHALHGQNGVERSIIDAFGRQVSPWKTVTPAVAGHGVRLTIDSRFERQTARDLKLGLDKLGVPQGTAVVMNPWNGQVLSTVSLPSYNPNVFTRASGRTRDRQIKSMVSNPDRPLVDNAVQAQMPPGSIYKIITATAGLEEGVINDATMVDDRGSLQRWQNRCQESRPGLSAGCRVFYGWKPGGLGWVNVVEALAESSDIFFYEVAGGGPDIGGYGLGPKRLGTWARRFGLGRPTGIELPGEEAGLVPGSKELWRTQHRAWSYGDSYNMGIGQGDDLVTPLQMASAVSAIANGGSLVRPQIVQSVTTPNGKRPLPGRNYGAVPDVVHPHFISRAVVTSVQEGLRLGVSSGLGTSHYNFDLRNLAAGKTGTAEAPGGGVDAWWIGYAPYDHPRIAVCVAIPNAGAEGAFSAAPIASKIIDDYLHIMDRHWLDRVQKILDFAN